MATRRIAIGITALALTAGAPLGAQPPDKAAQVLAATRAAIGGAKLDGLKTFAAEARIQRVIASFQINTDVELLLDMPDNWAEMDGIQFPRKIQRESEGTTLEEWTVSKIKVNPKIDQNPFGREPAAGHACDSEG